MQNNSFKLWGRKISHEMERCSGILLDKQSYQKASRIEVCFCKCVSEHACVCKHGYTQLWGHNHSENKPKPWLEGHNKISTVVNFWWQDSEWLLFPFFTYLYFVNFLELLHVTSVWDKINFTISDTLKKKKLTLGSWGRLGMPLLLLPHP